MKKIISIIPLLAVFASLTACSEIGFPAENISDEPNTSQNIMPSQSLTSSSLNTMSSEESSLSEEEILWASTQPYLDLKGEELIAKFEWPYDDPIDLTGMTVEKKDLTAHGLENYESIPLSEISNYFQWQVECDYGYLTMMPEKGGEYEYKKYKAGDKIGDFTVTQIRTSFSNVNFAFKKYFDGVRASFDGEITLVGEFRLTLLNSDTGIPPISDMKFTPNEESQKKIPIANFSPLIDLPDEYSDWWLKDYFTIFLGNMEDYPNIDFAKFPDDGSPVNVKITITDYAYIAESGLPIPFSGFANIVDLEII